MKKLLILLLCLVLLTGCTEDRQQKPTTPPATQPQPSNPALYLPDSALETQTQHALRSYGVDEQVLRLEPMGKDLLVCTTTGDGRIRLRLLTGEKGVVRCQRLLEAGAEAGNSLRVSSNGICYYNSLEKTVVVLDKNLEEHERTSVPGQITGEPVVSQDLTTVYYCVADEIRALSLETSVSRLVKQHACQWQTLVGLVNYDSLLLCRMDVDGQIQTYYISTQDGQTLGSDAANGSFVDGGQHYFLQRQDGIVMEYLHGSYSGQIYAFALDDSDKTFQYVPGIHSVLAVSETDGGCVLELYDLESGLLASRVALNGVQTAYAVTALDGFVWFAADQGGTQLICRWDLQTTAQTGNVDYVTDRYTAAAPDAAGLARCQEKADRLNQLYGTNVMVMPGAVVQPEDYTLVTEHQVEAIEAGLQELELALARFPEDFFRRIAKDTAGQKLNIALVRSISEDRAALQYWVEADAYIALTVGSDVEQIFYHELSYVLDTFIYSNSRDLDVWNKLNPKDFAYDYSYQLYTSHGNQYLEGEDRAFVDAYSRTYPKEDRARILEYAMMPGNEGVFASETMQKKLHLLCFSIRDAFNWKKDARVFPWEQYLNEPLAYTKKK